MPKARERGMPDDICWNLGGDYDIDFDLLFDSMNNLVYLSIDYLTWAGLYLDSLDRYWI